MSSFSDSNNAQISVHTNRGLATGTMLCSGEWEKRENCVKLLHVACSTPVFHNSAQCDNSTYVCILLISTSVLGLVR